MNSMYAACAQLVQEREGVSENWEKAGAGPGGEK